MMTVQIIWMICKVACGMVGMAVFAALVAWPLWRDDVDTIAACRGEHEHERNGE